MGREALGLIHGLVRMQGHGLASRMGQPGHGVSEISDFLMLQLLNRAQTGHGFWLQQLEGSTFDRYRLIYLRTLMSDYTQATTEEMRALAARYLGAQRGWRLAVLPQAGASGGARR